MALLCAALISCNKNTVDNPPQGGDGTSGIPEEYGEFELAEGAVFIMSDQFRRSGEEIPGRSRE